MTLLYIQFSLNSFKCYSNILDKFNVWRKKILIYSFVKDLVMLSHSCFPWLLQFRKRAQADTMAPVAKRPCRENSAKSVGPPRSIFSYFENWSFVTSRSSSEPISYTLVDSVLLNLAAYLIWHGVCDPTCAFMCSKCFIM